MRHAIVGIGFGLALLAGNLAFAERHASELAPMPQPSWLAQEDAFTQETWRAFREQGFYINNPRTFHILKTQVFLSYAKSASTLKPEASDMEIQLALWDSVEQVIQQYQLRERGLSYVIDGGDRELDTRRAFARVIYHSCYDGDTCTFTLPGIHPLFGSRIPVRLAGIDTPEIRGRCAQEKRRAIEARDVVRQLLQQAERIDLRDAERGKYFRLVARIDADGIDVAELLIDRGLAVRYDGGKKTANWCE